MRCLMDLQRQVALQFSELIDVNSNTRKDQGRKRHISPGREEGDAVIFAKTISERFPAALPNCKRSGSSEGDFAVILVIAKWRQYPRCTIKHSRCCGQRATYVARRQRPRRFGSLSRGIA